MRVGAEVVRQIRLSPLGLWHRPELGNGHTACGEELGGAVAARDDPGDGLDLCPICFPERPRFIDTAKIRKLLREEAERVETDEGFDEEDTAEFEIVVIPNDHDRKKP